MAFWNGNYSGADFLKFCKQGDLTLCKKVYAINSDVVNHTDINGLTPLMLSLWQKHIEVSLWLLHTVGVTVNPTAANKWGESELHYAGWYAADKEMVELLLARGGVNVVNRKGSGRLTALECGVRFNNMDVITLLAKVEGVHWDVSGLENIARLLIHISNSIHPTITTKITFDLV